MGEEAPLNGVHKIMRVCLSRLGCSSMNGDLRGGVGFGMGADRVATTTDSHCRVRVRQNE